MWAQGFPKLHSLLAVACGGQMRRIFPLAVALFQADLLLVVFPPPDDKLFSRASSP